MAITLVHSTSGNATSNTVTLTVPSTTAGNAYIVGITFLGSTQNPSAVSSVTLGGSGTGFSQAVLTGSAATTVPGTAIWAGVNIAGGQTSLVVTMTSDGVGTVGVSVFACEVSGLATSSIVDKASSSSGTSATFTSGATATTTQAAEFWFGVGQAAAGGAITLTGPTSPWTDFTEITGTIGGVNVASIAGSQITTATGAATYSGTISASNTFSGCVATFLPAGTVAPGGPIYRGPVSALGVQASGTTVTATWSTNPAPGSKILVAVLANGTVAPTGVVDNGATVTTFTLDKSQAGSSTSLYVFRGDNVRMPASGSYTVTATFAGTNTYVAAGGAYTGVQPGAPVASAAATGTSTAPSAGALAPAGTGHAALYFGAFEDGSSLASEVIALNWAAGTQQLVEVNGSTYQAGAIADAITSGSQTPAWTIGDSVNWAAAGVVYNALPQPSMHQPVSPQHHPGPRGKTMRSPGKFSGAGPPLKALTSPVRQRKGAETPQAGRVYKSWIKPAAGTAPVLGTPSRVKPFIFHGPAPRRALVPGAAATNPAGGIASRIVTPLGTPSRPKPSVFRSPPPHRGIAGNNVQCGDGVAVAPVAVVPFTALLSSVPGAARPGLLTPGDPGPATVPGVSGTAPYLPALAIARRSPAPRRALVPGGNTGTPAGGLASHVSTPLGAPSRPRPFVARSAAPHRAVCGNNMQCGDGVAASAPAVAAVTYLKPPRPAVRPAPARARTGKLGLCAAGIASQIVTSRGSPSPAHPSVSRSPAPARARLGAGAPGAPSLYSATYGTTYPGANPVITVTGMSWAGIASQAVTPLGSPAPVRPLVIARPAPRRARVGNNLACGDGNAATAPAAIAATAYQRPPVVIARRSPARARAGTGLTAGGVASRIVTPLGATGPRLPLQARRPAPSRGHWGGTAGPGNAVPAGNAPRPQPVRSPAPRRVLWRGLASRASTPLGNPGPPKPFVARKPAARAVTGFLGRNAGGYPGHNACPAFPLAGPYVYQSMLVPAYSYPNPPGFWLNMMAAVPPVRYVVANVASGPGVTADPNYTAVINAALAAGLTVLGYVDTNYAAVPGATADANTALWQSLYGVTSIFFDRASSLTGDEPYYASRAAAVHATPGAITAMNFGTIPDSGYMASADIAVVFEGDYATGWQTFTPAGWMAGYNPSRFCVLVANARTTAQMQSVLVTAKTDGIGVVYVTPEPSPPTYSVWPGNQYCPSEAAQINADNAVAAIGRPVIQHLPGRRGQAGPARAAGAGVASRISTLPGGPSSPAPRPVIQHLPGRRAIGRGLLGAANAPLGTIAPARKVPLFPPRNTRARVGHGTVAGGVLAGANLPPGAAAYQRIAPVIKRPAPSRAVTGHGGIAGGVRGLVNPALSSALGSQHAWIFRSPAPHRALAGNNLACGDGVASSAVTPLGAPSRPRPFVFRSPAPHRGLTGNNLQSGDGIASQVTTPLGIPSRPKPFVWRSPAPHRAVLGNNLACGGGVASRVTTPLGAIAAPRLLLPWASHPRTRAIAGHGPVAGGVAGLINPPEGLPSSPPPRPVIQHLPQRRARVGNNIQPGDGIAVTTVTPPGAIGPPRPFVARKGPQRARLGGNLQLGDGVASPGVTPLGTPPVSLVRPVITRAPSVRAHCGPLGRNGTGNPASAVAVLGATGARTPRQPVSAPPARARTGPLGRNAGGIQGAPPITAAPAPGRRPQASRSAPPRHRALAGNNLACGGGLTGLVNPPLGTIPPRRIRQPWVSHPQSRAVAKGNSAPGPRAFIAGPGTVSAADRITATVKAADRQPLSVTATDRLLMDVEASDYEP